MRKPPIETRREPISDDYFGTKVKDPYRWLEDGSSQEVKAWVQAQNSLLESTLGKVKARPEIEARLSELLEIGTLSVPSVRRAAPGKFVYFYSRREGKQNQPILYVREGVHGKDTVLFDPNAQSAEGTVALDWYYPSQDGSLLAYGLSEGGTEQSTLYIRDVKTQKDLKDVIPRTRNASLCWTPERDRFFYTRYPAPGSVPQGEENYHRKIYEHRLGQAPDTDRLIFEPPSGKSTDFPNCTISPDGRFLVIHVHQGWSKSELYIADTRKPKLEFKRITEDKEHLYAAIAHNDALYIVTNENAPRYAVYRADPNAPERERWQLLVPEHASDVLSSIEVVRGEIFASYLHEAVSRLERFDRNGKSLGEIALPTLGTSDGFTGLHDGEEVFFQFESFAIAPSVRRLDLKTGKSELWQEVESGVKATDYTVVENKARSADGTLVPYVVVHSAHAVFGAEPRPTMLYGYGGFNISLRPRFSRANLLWLERGGAYVQANLRGGGELGEEWHRAAQREHKQRTFDDFIAVAEDLISQNVTSRDKLAIHGRSNGGLLVAAAVTQRPDLFRAAVSSVPITDMLRYDQFLIAKLWIPEYGSAKEATDFDFLYAYSPYHRVREGTKYPAVLLTTAEGDTRVDPLHARKFAAALQFATSSDHPVLLRTETEAGHGAGTPVKKLVSELTDIYTFALHELGMVE